MEEIRSLSLPTLENLGKMYFSNFEEMKEFLFTCGFCEADFEEDQAGNIKFTEESGYQNVFPEVLGMVTAEEVVRFNEETLYRIDRYVING